MILNDLKKGFEYTIFLLRRLVVNIVCRMVAFSCSILTQVVKLYQRYHSFGRWFSILAGLLLVIFFSDLEQMAQLSRCLLASNRARHYRCMTATLGPF